MTILLCIHINIYAKGSLLIENACFIDGTWEGIQEITSILIIDGCIVKIGNNIIREDIPQLDVRGAYILPGLIDSHVHLMWGPGAALSGSGVPMNIGRMDESKIKIYT